MNQVFIIFDPQGLSIITMSTSLPSTYGVERTGSTPYWDYTQDTTEGHSTRDLDTTIDYIRTCKRIEGREGTEWKSEEKTTKGPTGKFI